MSNLFNITKTKLKQFRKFQEPIYLEGFYVTNPCFSGKIETTQSLLWPILEDKSWVNVNYQLLDTSNSLGW